MRTLLFCRSLTDPPNPNSVINVKQRTQVEKFLHRIPNLGLAAGRCGAMFFVFCIIERVRRGGGPRKRVWGTNADVHGNWKNVHVHGELSSVAFFNDDLMKKENPARHPHTVSVRIINNAHLWFFSQAPQKSETYPRERRCHFCDLYTAVA